MAIKLASIKQCTGCGACHEVCAKHAIRMGYDKEGFLRPKIDFALCVECGQCQCSCPVLAPAIEIKAPLACYAAKCKNDDLRLASSSGGIFSVLALDILHRGGVVYGCAFDENFNAHHIRVTNEKDMAKLRGSKYMQSNLEDCFSLCRKDLINGRKVLFSGTPCQIAGLKKYLAKEYANLTTIEVICHGAPSPLLWKKYLNDLEKEEDSAIHSVEFRNKTYGTWKKYCFVASFLNNWKMVERHRDNLFMKCFLKNLCLRPSCYDCQFKSGKSGADFTLGDFWGIENLQTKLNYEKGISAVIVNSINGIEMWNDCLDEINSDECKLNDIVMRNTAHCSSVAVPPKRSYFMQHFQKMQLDKLFVKCTRKSLFNRAQEWLHRLFITESKK